MATKKVHERCGREVAHTAAGAPYRHNCRPLPTKVRCGTCDTDVPAREDGSVPYHHVPGSVTEVCAGADSVGPMGARNAISDEETEECEACGRGVPLEAGVLAEHLRPQAGYVGVPPVCDGSPGGPEESAGPAPFGEEAGLSLTPAEAVAAATPGGELVLAVRPELTDLVQRAQENAVDLPSLVVHPGPSVLGAPHIVAGASDTSAAMAFLTGGNGAAPQTADPSAVMAFLEAEEEIPLNVSGQPRERTNRSGYLITDPATGDFRRYQNGNVKGFTRCTTLIKAISDNAALHDWNKRNVLIGAVKRPDVVARAFGLTHDDGKERLDEIVDALEDIAGAKIAAQAGTDVHEVSERLDGGELALADVPPYWRALMIEYRRKLGEHGLEPVRGLIERTTYTSRYGGVAGTFDRILFHRPSRTYVMSDVKTGQAATTYGRLEIPAQLAVYAEGANENGVYDWNTDTWHPLEHRVRTDWGLMIHMPLQGPMAHTVELYPAPLDYGRRVAEECARVRLGRSSAPKFLPMQPGFLGEVNWETEFSTVRTSKEASRLWNDARAAGVPALRLNELVKLAQISLSQEASRDVDVSDHAE